MRSCKNPCDDCNRVDCDGRETRPCQNKTDSSDIDRNGRKSVVSSSCVEDKIR
jgi:hypothetical protein